METWHWIFFGVALVLIVVQQLVLGARLRSKQWWIDYWVEDRRQLQQRFDKIHDQLDKSRKLASGWDNRINDAIKVLEGTHKAVQVETRSKTLLGAGQKPPNAIRFAKPEGSSKWSHWTETV